MTERKRIALFAGTTEGRKIAEHFCGRDVMIDVFCATPYGASLIPDAPNILSHEGRLKEPEIRQFLREIQPEVCVDATHPYASVITDSLHRICGEEGIPYLRVQRDVGEAEEKMQAAADSSRKVVSSAEEAAAFLRGQKGRILLTTGSKELEAFCTPEDLRGRCIVRVLPAAAAIEKCRQAGFQANQIVAMQGPFSADLNAALLREWRIDWLVTKDSGEEGGCPEKLRAAGQTGTGVVLIKRPEADVPGLSLQRTIRWLDQMFISVTSVSDSLQSEQASPAGVRTANHLSSGKHRVSLIGMGPGDLSLLTAEAKEAVLQADAWIGSPRMLEMAEALRKEAHAGDSSGRTEDKAPGSGETGSAEPENRAAKNKMPLQVKSISASDTAAWLKARPDITHAAVLYSGDIALCSGAAQLRPLLKEETEVRLLSGISSLAVFLARCGCALEDTRIVTLHGKDRDLLPLIRTERRLAVLIGRGDTLRKIAQSLLEFDMPFVKITLGERLTYPDERFISGEPADFADCETKTLSLLLFENPHPEKIPQGFGLPDERFIRGGVPMTKREVRSVALGALSPDPDSVVWDIGAGTGSVSVEAALHCPDGLVCAFERDAGALELLAANRKKFRCSNLRIIAGEAPETLRRADVPDPDAVFIGGSGGHLKEIAEEIQKRSPHARIVITAVTEETAEEIRELESGWSSGSIKRETMKTEILAVRHTRAGRYHLRKAENPVLIAVISEKEVYDEEEV